MGYYWKQDRDIMLDAAMGRIAGVSVVNKFGRAPSGVQITATDIWSRADATPTQSIWVAPTQARIHDIASNSAADDFATGDGALTVRVWGLTSWDAVETYEDVDLDGIVASPTAAAYVIIHRMSVTLFGANAAAPNVGTITATAQTDGSISALILPGIGQTEMAILGIPSCCSLVLFELRASMRRATAGATVGVDIDLRYNPIPDVQLGGFISKHTESIFGGGSSELRQIFVAPNVFNGPGIIKMQATATSADVDLSAGFGGLLIQDT